ncbi:MFS transporter [Streptomyces sp. 5-10]|uniref:MFS transporter n=1 Tax=Streptomyces sp. 5-10 TaxID=878925 RepID=UPI00168BB77F|nr:MFS transporter [Streptomyces sp. 5-10]MBD3003816.1 MFS transporter [Streptomyces sp. 5-10]
MARRARLATLIALYAGQYLAMGLLVALPSILREQGASLRQVGVVSLVNLAVIAKVSWAPLVDRYGRHRGSGHYRTWLLIIQPLIVVTLVALATVDIGGGFTALLTGACVLAVLVGTQDIATDALAVRLIDPADRGWANAVQVGAGFAGAAVGTTGMFIAYQHLGWSGSVAVLAGLCLLPMAAVYAITEPAAGLETRATGRAGGSGLRAMLSLRRVPGVAAWAGLLVPLIWGGVMLPQSLMGPLLVDHGWHLGSLGLLTSVLGGGCGIAGASAAGRLVGRLGRGRVLLGACAVQLAATAALMAVAAGASGPAAVTVVAALGLARGAVNTVIFTAFMDFCRPETAGSDFTLLSAWGYAVAAVVQAAGPTLAGAAGYPTAIAVAAVMTGVALVYLRMPRTYGALAAVQAAPVPKSSGGVRPEQPLQDAR